MVSKNVSNISRIINHKIDKEKPPIVSTKTSTYIKTMDSLTAKLIC